MKALLVSPDPEARGTLRLTLESAERRTGERWEYFAATNGLEAIRLAWREMPEIIVADEIASVAGAFALAKELKGAAPPHPAAIIVILAREQDVWLAKWSTADAWFVRPVDPFALADTVVELVGGQGRAGEETA